MLCKVIVLKLICERGRYSMNIKFLEKKIKEKDKNFFDLKKFKIKDLRIDDCEINGKSIDNFVIDEEENYDFVIRPKQNRRKKKYLYQCQVCNRFFLGGYDASGHYIGNCFKMFEEERERFWNSDLILRKNVEKNGIAVYDVNSLLLLIKTDEAFNKKIPGVWALWINYEQENEQCIQVAKNLNIYGEIMGDFCKGEGSLDYTQYKDNGSIVIVATGCSDFGIEAQYAHDYRASMWNMNFKETKLLGEYKGMRTNNGK